MQKEPTKKNDVKAVNLLDGIYRKTLAYNKNVMLCQFILKKDAEIPLHSYEAHQIGYIVSGKVKFKTETRGDFIIQQGDGYVFNSWEKYGAKILETAEVIDVFSPVREDYK